MSTPPGRPARPARAPRPVTRPAPAQQARPVTWLDHDWEPGDWLHPLYGAGGVYAAGMAEHLAHISPWAMSASPLLLGGIGLLATAGERFRDITRAYFTGAGVLAGGWLTFVAATSPYSQWSLLSGIAAATIAVGAYKPMRYMQVEHEEEFQSRRRHGDTERPAGAAPAGPSSDKQRWEALFTSIGLAGLTFLERVSNRAGFTLRIQLPAHGRIKFSTVVAAAEALEIAAKMPRDCVRVEQAPGESRRAIAGEVWIHFDVRDILTEIVPLPEDRGPLSVNEAFPIGVYTDGEPICLNLREVATLITGVRGRGKTNLLNVIIYQLSRCEDVVIWMIDLKGGRAAKPWLQPWADGGADRRVLDWVATTREEAHRMIVGAKALIEQRGAAGDGGTKIRPTRNLPAVLVICDEIAAVVGQHSGPRSRFDGQGPTSADLASLLTLCIQLGRSEAVDFVLATQRPTVTMVGNGDLKSQVEQRIGMGVTNPQDAQSVFQGSPPAAALLVRLKDQRTRGAVLIQEGDERILPGKAFFCGDDNAALELIGRAAVAHQDYPADLDERGAAAVDAAVRQLGDGSAGYADRWSHRRAGHLYSNRAAPVPDPAPSDGPPRQRQRPASGGGGLSAMLARAEKRESEVRPAGQSSRFYPPGGLRRQQPPAPVTAPVVEQTPSANADDPQWQRLVAMLERPDVSVPDPEQDGDVDRQARMVEIVCKAGTRGISATELVGQMVREGLITKAGRTAIYRWMTKAKADGKVVQPAGEGGLYFTRENVR